MVPSSMKMIGEKKIDPTIFSFFAITTLLAVVGAPIYLYHYGISLSEVLLLVFYLAATGFSITVGYHRLYAHATFKAHPVIHFLTLFFGAAAFEQSALLWSAQHRYHHQYVDTDQDPYNIKKGFFYAHMGWLLFWRFNTPFTNSKDLQKSKLLMHQHKYYRTWAATSGILFPLLLGALTGHLLGALLLVVCCRLALVHQTTFCINSVCHMFGKATYDIYASAKDHWLVAFVTNGEGYHNFHHRFPTDYRNGVRLYHWDPSKWFIFCLAKLGLASHLRTVSPFAILEARLAAEKQRVDDRLIHLEDFSKLLDFLKLRYQKLEETLKHWDHAVKEYQGMLGEQGSRLSKELKKSALQRIQQTRSKFKESYSQWSELIALHPLDLQRTIQLSPIS